MHESPPFDGLSANRGGEIRTRDLLNPIQARYRTAPRPDAEICGLLRGSAGLQTANPAQIPPNLAHNVAHLGAGGPAFPAAKIRECAGKRYRGGLHSRAADSFRCTSWFRLLAWRQTGC